MVLKQRHVRDGLAFLYGDGSECCFLIHFLFSVYRVPGGQSACVDHADDFNPVDCEEKNWLEDEDWLAGRDLLCRCVGLRIRGSNS